MKLKSVVAILVAVSIYAYGQLAQATKSYPTLDTFGTVSPELFGAILSSLMLIVIPILVSLMISAKTGEP